MRVGSRRPREWEASEERAVCGIHRLPVKLGAAMRLLFGPGSVPGRNPSASERMHVEPLAAGDTEPVVGGKRIKRNKWAGAYPEDFCRAWAQVVRASVAGV